MHMSPTCQMDSKVCANQINFMKVLGSETRKKRIARINKVADQAVNRQGGGLWFQRETETTQIILGGFEKTGWC